MSEPSLKGTFSPHADRLDATAVPSCERSLTLTNVAARLVSDPDPVVAFDSTGALSISAMLALARCPLDVLNSPLLPRFDANGMLDTLATAFSLEAPSPRRVCEIWILSWAMDEQSKGACPDNEVVEGTAESKVGTRDCSPGRSRRGAARSALR